MAIWYMRLLEEGMIEFEHQLHTFTEGKKEQKYINMKKDTVVDSLITIVGFVMNYTRTRVRYMQRTLQKTFVLE